ncbi:MAG: S-layer homology domain-containing protein, partial [Clostridia bacterium]|nr:S-layer homology domain-containing protein [Clostridia bacterium]
TVSLVEGLEDGWYVNRYTLEMYAKEGSGIGFDNFVLYDRPVQFVSFDIGQGGAVSLGQDKTISAGGAGYQSEVAIASGTALSFGVVPQGEYELSKLTVNNQDMTSLFAETTSLVNVLSAVTNPVKVAAEFQTDVPAAPVISNGTLTGNPVLNSELSVQYQFSDENGDLDDQSKTAVIWERSADGETDWQTIGGATGRTYQLTKEDVKHYIRAKITAYADAQPYESNQIITAAYGPVSGNIYAISSPAWRVAPVLKTLDFDTDSSGWSKAGAYSSTMNYNDQAVKTLDGSKYLEITRENGAAGQRADLRVWLNEKNTAVLDFDFKAKGVYGDTQGLGMINLAMLDSTNTRKEGRMVTVKGTSFGETSIQSDTWYRVRVTTHRDTKTYDYELFSLDSQGRMGTSVYSRSGNGLPLDGLNDDWYLNGITVEMYGAPESMIAFDNFVVYSQEVHTASFTVYEGGKVLIGDDEITPESRGIAAEAAAAKEQTMIFTVQPEEGYRLRSVTINGVDRTDWFTAGQETDIGFLEGICNISVAFQKDQPAAPVISNVKLSGYGIPGSELTVTYDYFDSNYDPEDEAGAVIRWQRSADGQASWTDIPGASGRNYTVTEEDQGSFLRAVVKAKASAEPYYSDELASEGMAIGSRNYYVSPEGNDENDGSAEQPFATITAARDAIRKARAEGTLPSGGIVVNIKGGRYPVTQAIVFDQRDSGSDGNPVIYQGYGDQPVVFEGGREIDSSKAVKVTDQAILDRVLDETARNKLMMIDLGAEGIDVPELISYGHAVNAGWRPLEVYINGTALEKSVWPNADSETGKFLRTTSAVLEGTDNRQGPFTIGYPDPEGHTKLWSEEGIQDLMIGGFLSNDYSCQHLQVASLDADALTLLTREGSSYAPAKDRRFYFWNIIEEIDQPGESYIDREKDIVYFYPAVDMTDAEIVVSTLQDKMLVVDQGSNITFRNLDFEFTRETVANITGDHITLEGCTIAHTSGTGVIASGTDLVIQNCNIYDCGYGGINISGGDRINLVSSGNIIHNNRIHDNGRVKETYSPAINVAGMGVTITHNELYNNASQIIGMTGNDHLIAYNNIYESVMESADQGAVYWGRNPSELGIRIMYNYFHDMENAYGGYGHQAVFWDDGAYGPYIYGNVFFRSSNTKQTGDPARTNALKTNGGAFSHIQNNIFIDGANAFNPHKWNNGTKAYGWWLFMYDKFDLRYNPIYEEKMLAVPVNGENWTNHYGNFTWTDENGKTFSTDLWSHLSASFSQTHADAMKDHDRMTDQDFLYEYAKENGPSFGNVFENNVCVDISQVVYNNGGQAAETNTFSTSDHSIFEQYGADFTLTEAGLNTVRAKIPGFENIPFSEMGLTSPVGGTVPAVTNAVILGESGTGDMVQVSYSYQSREGIQEGVSRFEWYLSDSENGTYQKLAYRDSQLLIRGDYKNQYLKCQITPVSRSGLEGEPVMTQPIQVGKTLSAGETLKAMISQGESRLEKTPVGDTFGCVSEQAAQDFSKALEEAKKTDLEDTDAVYSAVDLLNSALERFLSEVNTDLSQPITSAGTYQVEPFMGDLNFTIAQETSDVSITLPTGEALQEIQVNGFITVDGAAVPTVLTLQKGTVITATGKDTVTLRLFGDDSAPSQTVALAQDGKITAIHVSDDVLTLSQPAVYQFEGIDKGKLAGALTTKYTSIGMVVSSVEDMSGSYARLNTENGFGIAAKELKELVLYTKKTVQPTPSPSPLPVPTSAPSGGGGGSISIGGGGSSNKSETQPSNPFADLVSHWAKDDVLALYQKGIVAGVTSQSFEPDREITRAEFAAMLVRGLKITTPGELTFTDVDPHTWYAESVRIAAGAGLIQGYEGQFRPEDVITREEMAVVIAKGYLLKGHSPEQGAADRFTDRDEISGWAFDSVDIAATAGIISGMGDGRFAPAESATRAQAASMINRLLVK